jgi:iron complex outermembrane receptor protein
MMINSAQRFLGLLLGVMALAGAARGQAPEPVLDMSLEDLVNTEVVSASRKAQTLQQVAAAVFVITQEDIARSGARNLPDVLAMAPGIEVARIGNNRWAVSARGGTSRFANKLQVLKDGRSIYSPLFSGVFWEAEDMPLEDIERIEIIRGPNAAMWGSNAVNGTINVITRKARDTQGGLLAVSSGTEDTHNVTARYGMPLGDAGHMRVYAKTYDRRASFDADGSRASDKGDSGMAGFRADWLLSSGNRLSLSGEVNRDRNGDTYRFPDARLPAPAYSSPLDSTMTLNGGHLQGRYESLRDDGSQLAFQAYLTQTTLDAEHVLREERRTLDLDLQYRLAPSQRHDLMLGANYRVSSDTLTSPANSYVTFATPSRDFRLASVFANDDITLVPERLRITLGARLEHNNFSGTDLQPTARFLWTPDANRSVWGALSRATRTPSRAEGDVSIPLRVEQNPLTPLPIWVTYQNVGSGTLKSEKTDALEFGYRQRFGQDLSVDATAFTHRNTDGRIPQTGTMLPPAAPFTYLVLPSNTIYAERSRVSGLELAVFAQMTPTWRLQPSYTWMTTKEYGLGDTTSDQAAESGMQRLPHHLLSLRSQHNLPHAQQLDFWLRYRSKTHLDAATASLDMPSSTDLDIRYAWKASRSLELSVVGQNLLHRRTMGYLSDQLPSVPVETGRGAYFKAEYRF